MLPKPSKEALTALKFNQVDLEKLVKIKSVVLFNMDTQRVLSRRKVINLTRMAIRLKTSN